jgi:hypothetical protein
MKYENNILLWKRSCLQKYDLDSVSECYSHQTIVFLYQAKGMLISDSSGCNLLPGKIK